ncbi:MAG: OmpA family protein [Prevotellaceae bacterium]|jgi:outer membrane protein OmpA-like peptidoglycan-associated protein/tetratricopeptide (TPR) repeat protein|nr:OmpA family protein [Prevotellaceae bacterium]
MKIVLKNRIKYGASILLFAISTQLAAQNIEFDKKNFPDDKEGLKQAQSKIKEADKLFEKGSTRDLSQALLLYLDANKFNPKNAALNYKTGLCYLKGQEKAKAADFLETAFKLDPAVNPDVQLQLGRAYQYGYQFDEAIEAYAAYKSKLGAKEAETLRRVDKYITECKTGNKLKDNPIRVFIDNISDLNTAFPEYGPVISADESVVMFTSCRDNTTGGGRDEYGKFNEDIYFANGEGRRRWGNPANAGKPLNTEDHDAVIGISADGQRLFLYRMDNGGDIYESVLKGDSWSKPKSLGSKINSKYHESQASVSADGKTLYFISDRPGGFGGHDIYMSRINAKGEWSEATNLGPDINTEYEELCPFIHPDGKTLYFSSKGHAGIGGFDIFKSVYETGKWSEPENLGFPVNTPDDDLFFVLSANGKHGYFSSAREGGKGDHDLYMISFLGAEKQLIGNSEDMLIAYRTNPVSEKVVEEAVELPSSNLTLLKGLIRDNDTKNPVGASIILVDNLKNMVIATLESNSKTGRYLVSLPSGINYGISVKSEGYLFHSENFDIPAARGYQEVVKDIDLKKFDIGSKIVLRNIFFDTDKSTLRPESVYELTELLNLLKERPTLKIELSGHTDNRGSAAHNQKLSDDRAKSVVDYLTSKGIDASRLSHKGYGFEQPVASNDTEDGRQLNRRTEFKVIAK